MKYKIGNKVRVREWDDMVREYGIDKYGCINMKPYRFSYLVKNYCGEIVTISEVFDDGYHIAGNSQYWTDEMFQELIIRQRTKKAAVEDWETIASFFGVKLNEYFRVDGSGVMLYNPYKFTEKGLIRCGDIFDNKMLQNLINGDNHIIERNVEK